MEAEGIQVADITYVDNAPLLNMFMGQPIGLFSLVDEESRFPAATDQSLIEKLNKNFKKNEHYKVTRSVTLQFVVEHYAGNITYDVSGWIAKNRDVLTPSVMSVLQESSNDLVRHLFSTSQTLTGGLEANEASARLAERQENARELIQILRTSVWARDGSDMRKASKAKNLNGNPSAARPSGGLQRLDSAPSLPLTTTAKRVSA